MTQKLTLILTFKNPNAWWSILFFSRAEGCQSQQELHLRTLGSGRFGWRI